MSEPAKPFIIMKFQQVLSQEQRAIARQQAEALGSRLETQVVIADAGTDIEYRSDIGPLIKAIEQQTMAIDALAESNMALVDAMTQVDEEEVEEGQRPAYLDGSG